MSHAQLWMRNSMVVKLITLFPQITATFDCLPPAASSSKSWYLVRLVSWRNIPYSLYYRPAFNPVRTHHSCSTRTTAVSSLCYSIQMAWSSVLWSPFIWWWTFSYFPFLFLFNLIWTHLILVRKEVTEQFYRDNVESTLSLEGQESATAEPELNSVDDVLIDWLTEGDSMYSSTNLR